MNLSANLSRLHLAAFVAAVFGRTLGHSAVSAFAIFSQGPVGPEISIASLFLWLGLYAVPAFALAPLIGALASSHYRRLLMIASTLTGLAMIVAFPYGSQLLGDRYWVFCIAALACESACFRACAFAMLPEAARWARFPLPTLFSIFAVTCSIGLCLGFIAAGKEPAQAGMPLPLQYGHVGYGLALILLLMTSFPVVHPACIAKGLIKPLLQTTVAIAKSRQGSAALLLLCSLISIVLGLEAKLLPRESRLPFLVYFSLGAALSGLQRHAYRSSGLIPLASGGLFLCFVYTAISDDWSLAAAGIGFCIGLMLPPLLTVYTINQSETSRGQGGALLGAGAAIVTACFLAAVISFPDQRDLFFNTAFGLAFLGAVVACVCFFRGVFELFLEAIFWPLYRVRAIGPGVAELPWRGPAIVIANHAAWFDPFWLAKVLPPAVTPMMTSKYYDMPWISWIMRHILHGIRVPDAAMRKETPEIDEATAALDRGECIIIFPEGWLRRKESQELRRFARGVWHILTARPKTPVFACWIQGNWGSMVSYRNGPPFRNKKTDIRRRIGVGVIGPIMLESTILEAHMKTRTELMKHVLEARSLFNLPPFDPFKNDAPDEAVPEQES